MSDEPDRILITGANGHLGRLLLRKVAATFPRCSVRAAVRSERAAGQLRALPETVRPEIDIVDYRDPFALARAADRCSHAIHLVGILKQTRLNRYIDAHENASAAFAEAAARAELRRIVSLSILGADAQSSNACLASRGRADDLLLEGGVPALILRLPMVLGAGDAAAQALRREASAKRTALVRGGVTLEQPIGADDVANALVAGLVRPGLDRVSLDLAGPESLSHRELLERAAALLGSSVRVRSIPLFAARFAALLAEKLLADPPITRAMLGVLQQDDDVETRRACDLLGIELTPLDEVLQRCLSPEEETP